MDAGEIFSDFLSKLAILMMAVMVWGIGMGVVFMFAGDPTKKARALSAMGHVQAWIVSEWRWLTIRWTKEDEYLPPQRRAPE